MPVLSDLTVATTSFYQQATSEPQTPPQHSSLPNTGNSFLIAIEVIFSCLVIVVLAFCFFTGIRKKKRAFQSRQQMIDNAITQQERRFQLHLQGQCHSSSTLTTSIQCPLPTYTPPDPRHSLPKDVVSRLDCLLEQNQICTTAASTTTTTTICETLPTYTDLYRNSNNNSNNTNDNRC